MNRKQRREYERKMKKEERKVKKGQKPVSLHSTEESNRSELDTLLFGVYYKDDKDDGFNLVVDDTNPELLQYMLSMFDSVQQCFDETHHLVSVNEVCSNLEEGIRLWNDFQNCHDRNQKINYKIRIDLSNHEMVYSLFFIMYGVYHLVQLGVIKDDNFNGFHFVKTYRKVG
jgi:hypothetical protein